MTTTQTQAIEPELLDSDGENLAVRWFLAAYGGGVNNTKRMRDHLDACGYPYWPEQFADVDETLTKGGAQMWLRHLFSLEADRNKREAVMTDEEILEAFNCYRAAINPDILMRHNAVAFGRALLSAAQKVPKCESSDADKVDAMRLETIRLVRNHIVSVVRAFGEKACADYLDNWHNVEHIDQAIASATKENKNG